MKKKILLILVVFMIIFSTITSVEAIYVDEKCFTDELINEAIELGKQYKNESTSEGILIKEGYRFEQDLIIVDIKTKFFDIIDLSREKNRKYEEFSMPEIQNIIKQKYFSIIGYQIAYEKININNLHLIIQYIIIDDNGNENVKIIQPRNPTHKKDFYYGNDKYLGIMNFDFKYEDLPKINDNINYKIIVIFIYEDGEKRFEVDLNNIR